MGPMLVADIATDYRPHLSAPDMGRYLGAYADHFGLRKNIEFGKSVERLERDEQNSRWILHFSNASDSPRSFDKVVWATGEFLRPKRIKLPGQEVFIGQILHSQDVRNLQDFAGKNVVVLGMGNTAADLAVALVPLARQVTLSHRRGATIVCRTDADGLPGDLLQTNSASVVLWWIEQYLPSLLGKIMDSVLDASFKKKYGVNDPSWGFAQKASIGDGFHTVTCNDGLVPYVKAGKLLSKSAIKRVVGAKALELESGEILDDVDALITCTGYTNDMSMLSEAVTYAEPVKSDVSSLPNLYMNVFPPKHADSIAVASFTHVNGAQPPARELTSMAIAQIWSGKSALPSQSEMDVWIEQHYNWRKPRVVKEPNLHPGDLVTRPYMHFLHEAAGTGMLEHIGWSWKAWKLWWSDRKLYNALAHGPATSYGHRLFETGKRAAWPGARQAILDMADEVEVLKARKLKEA